MSEGNGLSPKTYSELDPERIQSTLVKLQMRISERFPGSGLGRVAQELYVVSEGVVRLGDRLARPYWKLRVLAIATILCVIGLSAWLAFLSIDFPLGSDTSDAELLQATESAINEVVFLGLIVLFFVTLETRVKRRWALQSLHRLRSITHVVDMHQLTKDPAHIIAPSAPTASSPERTMAAYELTRYLDYCSEMLALTSKLAALHVQRFDDPAVLSAVNDVESLTQGLSNKIWQKIMILDIVSEDRAHEGRHAAGRV